MKLFQLFAKSTSSKKFFSLLRYLDSFLDKKAILVSRFRVSQPGKRLITTHKLPNISSKSNQTFQLGQLIEYNVKNIEKSCTNCDREANSRPLFVF